ncbi:hypothetical protein ElyMa_006344000 [Elysia marginata]|uniref:Uncharacterized protein n=1 Tax=Elysia marginata TaxID=1093978 RepID=A0AAV4HJZ5_9GAST|nr:hypothetical protein ElyMa_006344000 [Elysia marginata]
MYQCYSRPSSSRHPPGHELGSTEADVPQRPPRRSTLKRPHKADQHGVKLPVPPAPGPVCVCVWSVMRNAWSSTSR